MKSHLRAVPDEPARQVDDPHATAASRADNDDGMAATAPVRWYASLTAHRDAFDMRIAATPDKVSTRSGNLWFASLTTDQPLDLGLAPEPDEVERRPAGLWFASLTEPPRHTRPIDLDPARRPRPPSEAEAAARRPWFTSLGEPRRPLDLGIRATAAELADRPTHAWCASLAAPEPQIDLGPGRVTPQPLAVRDWTQSLTERAPPRRPLDMRLSASADALASRPANAWYSSLRRLPPPWLRTDAQPAKAAPSKDAAALLALMLMPAALLSSILAIGTCFRFPAPAAEAPNVTAQVAPAPARTTIRPDRSAAAAPLSRASREPVAPGPGPVSGPVIAALPPVEASPPAAALVRPAPHQLELPRLAYAPRVPVVPVPWESVRPSIRLPIGPPLALATPRLPPAIVTESERAVPALAGRADLCAPSTQVASLADLGGATPGTAITALSDDEFGLQLAAAAKAQIAGFTIYSARYRRLAYPSGDVPSLYGACSDLVIRAYRRLGIDLQVLVTEARLGGDTNIAHRRTETLRVLFARSGKSFTPSEFPEDYRPGDIVTYHRPYSRVSRAHIAIVADVIGPSRRPMIIHNRGWGPQLEDALFVDRITGHYRFRGLGAPAQATLVASKLRQPAATAVAARGRVAF